MLERSTFKALMGVIETTQNAITKETQIFNDLFEDFDGVPKNLATVEDQLIQVLETEFNTDLTSWYVYDTFMGTVPLAITLDDGSERTIDDLDSLYDIISQGV
jgi:hypothetical protein